MHVLNRRFMFPKLLAMPNESCAALGMQAVLGCTTALGQESQQAAAAAVSTAHQRIAVTVPRCQRGMHPEVEETHHRCRAAMHRQLRRTPAQPPRMHLQLLRMRLTLQQLALR